MLERGRFAPSPSGALHLGSARTAIASELFARAAGGALVLRVEDLDAARVADGATPAMLGDLAWLGVDWDEGPDVGGPSGPYLQSERRALYEAALAQLQRQGCVYPCACSRREVELASQAPHGAEPIYPGACRDRASSEVIADARARGRDVAWRFAVPAGTVRFEDRVAGPCAQDVRRDVGDFVVYRADGVPAYQLAVVVDDIAMGVTEVVRGDDLLASTARQLLIYAALGARPPRWAHVPLLVGDDGVRLAKRHGSISIADLRARGVQPSRVRDALVASLAAEDPSRPFDPTRIARSPFTLGRLREALPEIG
jgi:glutamyl-tRNA synthetase